MSTNKEHLRRCTCKLRRLKSGEVLVIEMCAKCTHEEANAPDEKRS